MRSGCRTGRGTLSDKNLTPTQEDDTAARFLAEVRQRIEAATAGPWLLETDCDGEGDDNWTFPYGIRMPDAHTEHKDGSHHDWDYLYSELCEMTMPTAEFLVAARSDVPRLVAAVEAVLSLHQPGRRVVFGWCCERHESHLHFSITALEAAGVAACPDCSATVYVSCTGCPASTDIARCKTRAAISAALTGEASTDGN